VWHALAVHRERVAGRRPLGVARERASATAARIRNSVLAQSRPALAWASRRLPPVPVNPVWALPVALSVFIPWITWPIRFPNGRGVAFVPVWFALAAAGLIVWRLRRGSITPLAAAVIVVLAVTVLTDIRFVFTQAMRDVDIYLKAGLHWRQGTEVYPSALITAVPRDLSNYPFLYPPVTLPLFGALSALPHRVAIVLWTGASVAAYVAGLRLVGLPWRWCAVMLAWPAFAQGLWVGNVAVPLFLFFAIAPWRPAALAVLPIFKIYSALASLWLLRRQHWRSLAVGVLGVAAAAAFTLPLVGVERWREWLTGLSIYTASQKFVPQLFGFGLGRFLPALVFVALAGTLVVLALRARDPRDQLARLGVATIVASPSLYSHGFLVALPGMLRLATPWFWLAFGITACLPNLMWVLSMVVVVASWYVPRMRKTVAADAWHPLNAGVEPWAAAPRASSSPRAPAVAQVPSDRADGADGVRRPPSLD
jgi:Glycosyltransferase family 87